MRYLESPMDEFQSCYETIQLMYDEFFTLTELAVSLSGSYNTYSEKFNSCDSEFIRLYDKLQSQLPEEDE